ncbi:unnamed protein product [Mycena citricolor]|uniref:Uncharacterized protein n=1 Tax=Mycena citricolor TaxID=2018698 RepID=A0AAD2H6G9_9AGAR|nr:unnamed protein product [Mycena citricolor]
MVSVMENESRHEPVRDSQVATMGRLGTQESTETLIVREAQRTGVLNATLLQVRLTREMSSGDLRTDGCRKVFRGRQWVNISLRISAGRERMGERRARCVSSAANCSACSATSPFRIARVCAISESTLPASSAFPGSRSRLCIKISSSSSALAIFPCSRATCASFVRMTFRIDIASVSDGPALLERSRCASVRCFRSSCRAAWALAISASRLATSSLFC